MPPEIELFGVLMPSLLPVFLLSLVAMVVLDLAIGRAGLYRHLWHPSLFRFALFVCLFGAAGLLLIR
ncbi:DUF1656 domain-containing protein [Frateuria edaphi]|jgi:hypothetical protein|uniref:DUF1656 domain-containing protein n=1 Tax=Frateuria TaxID=70411 RepID=UPI001E2BEE21|nr:DUF1656 domain-containing protein [Frateuria edaphi]UGB45811.1 DUF1656 domain-containing protein [Frateuria edaphi]